jgi:pimeloyl-ACP methyl ester carboxylesterase
VNAIPKQQDTSEVKEPAGKPVAALGSTMISSAMRCRDAWVRHPRGRLFSRSWAAPAAQAAARAPIVLFHDSLGSVELWRDFPAQLSAATARRVIAYDRLGFGRSDACSGRLALDFIEEEARSVFPCLREQLGFDAFVAFGHSVGGAMAVHCAVEWAASCQAVVTESAQAFLEDRTLQGVVAAQRQFQDPAQFERLARYHGSRAAWVLDAWVGTWTDPRFAAWSLQAVLARLRSPLLAIHGELDEYGSALQPGRIVQWSGAPARLELLAATHHVPHRERAQSVVDLVAGFLDAA